MSKMRYRTLRESVAEEIKKKIRNHELRPGMRVIEQNLSDELEVSRGPIREALRQLEQEGLVEYTRNVGCSIKNVSFRDLYEIYVLRATYEILAARLCNGNYTEKVLQEMEKILGQMKEIEDYRQVVEYDHRLHQMIVESAGFERIKKVWMDLEYCDIVNSYLVEVEEEVAMKRQYKIHRELIDACRTNDADIICKALYEHYLESFRLLAGKEILPEGIVDFSSISPLDMKL